MERSLRYVVTRTNGKETERVRRLSKRDAERIVERDLNAGFGSWMKPEQCSRGVYR